MAERYVVLPLTVGNFLVAHYPLRESEVTWHQQLVARVGYGNGGLQVVVVDMMIVGRTGLVLKLYNLAYFYVGEGYLQRMVIVRRFLVKNVLLAQLGFYHLSVDKVVGKAADVGDELLCVG